MSSLIDLDSKLKKMQEEKAQISDLVSFLFHQAIEHRASDIYLEPLEEVISIRYRVDGMLHDVAELPLELQDKLVSRIKVLANLIVYRRDIPQDGHIARGFQEKGVDLRVTTFSGVFARLIAMEIEPFLIASSISGVLAQRLVRIICPKCKEPYQPNRGLIKVLGLSGASSSSFFKGRGCSECSRTGYQGRIAITELLPVKEKFREAILRKSSTSALDRVAREMGMRNLREDGLRKARQGLTTLEELQRAIVSEEGLDIEDDQG